MELVSCVQEDLPPPLDWKQALLYEFKKILIQLVLMAIFFYIYKQQWLGSASSLVGGAEGVDRAEVSRGEM